MIFCANIHDIANADPSKKPAILRPMILTDISNNNDSIKIAIIGPKITALGDIVFISAQINPDLQNNPLSLHLYAAEIISTKPIAVSIFPLNGIRRLCKKLPNIISEAAHVDPKTEAFNHVSLSCVLSCIIISGIQIL